MQANQCVASAKQFTFNFTVFVKKVEESSPTRLDRNILMELDVSDEYIGGNKLNEIAEKTNL